MSTTSPPSEHRKRASPAHRSGGVASSFGDGLVVEHPDAIAKRAKSTLGSPPAMARALPLFADDDAELRASQVHQRDDRYEGLLDDQPTDELESEAPLIVLVSAAPSHLVPSLSNPSRIGTRPRKSVSFATSTKTNDGSRVDIEEAEAAVASGSTSPLERTLRQGMSAEDITAQRAAIARALATPVPILRLPSFLTSRCSSAPAAGGLTIQLGVPRPRGSPGLDGTCTTPASAVISVAVLATPGGEPSRAATEGKPGLSRFGSFPLSYASPPPPCSSAPPGAAELPPCTPANTFASPSPLHPLSIPLSLFPASSPPPTALAPSPASSRASLKRSFADLHVPVGGVIPPPSTNGNGGGSVDPIPGPASPCFDVALEQFTEMDTSTGPGGFGFGRSSSAVPAPAPHPMLLSVCVGDGPTGVVPVGLGSPVAAQVFTGLSLFGTGGTSNVSGFGGGYGGGAISFATSSPASPTANMTPSNRAAAVSGHISPFATRSPFARSPMPHRQPMTGFGGHPLTHSPQQQPHQPPPLFTPTGLPPQSPFLFHSPRAMPASASPAHNNELRPLALTTVADSDAMC